MFDNCKTCMFYDEEYDKTERELNDEDIRDNPNPNPHFCRSWINGIPKDIWNGKTYCNNQYIKKQD